MAQRRADCWCDAQQIALAEAINNIVEHAYRGLETGAIALRIEVTDARLNVRVRDWGHPLPNRRLPKGQSPDPKRFPEGGYGWFLIRTLADDCSYDRNAGANELCLTWWL